MRIFLHPIHLIFFLKLIKYMFNPDMFTFKCRVWRIQWILGMWLINKVSSAIFYTLSHLYCCPLYPYYFKLRVLLINKFGEMGFFCLHPLSDWKYLDIMQFCVMHEVILWWRSEFYLHLIDFSKLKYSKYSTIKFSRH